MKFKSSILILTAIILACFLGLAQAADFSAKVVSHMGPQKVQGKVYLKGEKMRQEFSMGGGKSINIARPDKNVMWVLMPAQKFYMEMPFQETDLAKTMRMPKDKTKMKLVGTETVNGYETEKYETVVKSDGKTMKFDLWVAKKLGVPIKMVSKDGSYSMEYLDIKEGNVPDSVFKVPSGYRKMPMPQGMPRGQ